MSFATDAFAGRSVLVVGGTSGIGAGIARAFAEHGAEVRVTGATAAEVARASDLAASVLDVRDAAAVAALIGRLARLDVLVNCAGVIRRGREHDPEVFADVVDINLNGTQRCCVAARPLLAAQRGCIVNTASMLSFFGGGLVPGYSASKGGVAQLTKSLATAWAEDNIQVNCFLPGFIDTPLTRGGRQQLPGLHEKVIDRTPANRWGHIDDFRGIAVFLASSASDFITGTAIPVDGGFSISVL